MSNGSGSTERTYRLHLWRMALGLAFHIAVAAGMSLALLRPELKTALVVVPMVVFLIASVTLGIAVSGRRWPRMTEDERRLIDDEWVRMNAGRARKVSLRTVWLAQVPLMFLVAYVPNEPTVGTSVVGMAMLTISVAGATFCGSYLIFSRGAGNG